MKTLLTGCNGFLGQELGNLFSKDKRFELIKTNRKTLDVSNEKEVDKFFEDNFIDVVIHTAVKGGKRLDKDSQETYEHNLSMYHNLKKNSNNFGLMIHFGSGAEFDRSSGVDMVQEEQIYDFFPDDYYGSVKNLIARSITDFNENIYNLRLFGCFGEKETESRLIKSCINKIKNNKPIEIHQNKMMDYFYVNDLYRVITFIVENKEKRLAKDINMCYKNKVDLISIAEMIKNICNAKVDINLINDQMGLPYTGDPKRLNSLGIKLDGLEFGIREMCRKLL